MVGWVEEGAREHVPRATAIDEDLRAMISGLDSFLPPVIPARWSSIRVPDVTANLPGCEALGWSNALEGLRVFLSLEDRRDHGIWLHMSVVQLGSRKGGIALRCA